MQFTRESSVEVQQNSAKQLFRLPCWHFADNSSYSQSYGFSSSHGWMWALDHKEDWASKNCGVGEDSRKSLGQKEIKLVNLKGNQPWIFIGRTDAEDPILWPPDTNSTHGKITWCWERLKAGAEGGDRGWDGWMASPTQLTWVWANSGRWWRTGKPEELQSMGSWRVRYDLVTEQQQQSRAGPQFSSVL